jgi:tRNA 2-selenouridine synthase SelU
MRTGNRYIDMNSQLQYMYGMLETDASMLNNFEQKLQSIITEFHQQMHLNNRTKADTNGEFVSFFPAVDKRRVYQSKKSRFERTRKVRRKQKPVYSKITKMSNDSMMRWFEVIVNKIYTQPLSRWVH